MTTPHPLRLWRESRSPKISQEVLAAKLGTTKFVVSRIETNARDASGALLRRIEDVTGISPSKIVEARRQSLSQAAECA